MADRYTNFALLSASEMAGVDYQIRSQDRQSSIVILAPHGGWIEPGTSEIAEAIAEATFSFYAFEGLVAGRPHGHLHITSHRFDEPIGLQLVEAADLAIAIHGRADEGDRETIHFGGRDTRLAEQIAASLGTLGYKVDTATGSLAGLDGANICNRARSGAGVQIELPKALRTALKQDQPRLIAFAHAIRVTSQAAAVEGL